MIKSRTIRNLILSVKVDLLLRSGPNSSVQSVRHILSLSGGKDSTALAIYMRDSIPELEYIFCDTGSELPETKEYLDRLEVYLGKPIKRLNSE